MRKIILLVIISLIANIANAQMNAYYVWDSIYGGNNVENNRAILKMPNGNYLLSGDTWSGSNEFITQGTAGGPDYWLIEVDEQGNKIWDKTYGCLGLEYLEIVKRSETNIYLVGSKNFFNVAAPACSIMSDSYYFGTQSWIVKTDLQGNVIWDKTIQIPEDLVYAKDIVITSDAIYIISSANTGISGDKDSYGYGNYDYWIIKLDMNGNKIWDKTFGGNNGEAAHAAILTNSNTILIAGTSASDSSGLKFSHRFANDTLTTDIWLIEIDTAGNRIWDNTYGGINGEWEPNIVKNNLVFYLACSSNSTISGNKTTPSKGESDFWVLKLNSNGAIINQWSYGGDKTENLSDIIKPKDENGFLLLGVTTSILNGDISESDSLNGVYVPSSGSAWAIRIDSLGNKIYDRKIFATETLGITKGVYINTNEFFIFLTLITDNNNISGYQSHPSIYGEDFWLVRFKEENTSGVELINTPYSFSIFPNPAHSITTITGNVVEAGNEIKIYDLLGKLVLQHIITQNKKCELNIEELASGIYLIKISSNKNNYTQKIIVE